MLFCVAPGKSSLFYWRAREEIKRKKNYFHIKTKHRNQATQLFFPFWFVLFIRVQALLHTTTITTTIIVTTTSDKIKIFWHFGLWMLFKRKANTTHTLLRKNTYLIWKASKEDKRKTVSIKKENINDNPKCLSTLTDKFKMPSTGTKCPGCKPRSRARATESRPSSLTWSTSQGLWEGLQLVSTMV